MKARWVVRAMAAVVVLGVVMTAATAGGAVSSAAPGVDATTIRVGFMYPDLSELPAGLNLPDTGDFEAQAKAYVDALNQRGGINGRKVELKTYKFAATTDILASMRAKCLEATEDDKVFAIVTPSMFGDPILCVTRQHKTPMILGGGTPQELVAKSNKLLYLLNFTTTHAIQASVDPLVKAKALKGKKLAVILEDTPGFDDAIENGLVKPLAKHGISIVDKVTIGLTAEGIGAVPAAVQRLKSEGVDGIFIAVSGYVAPIFMQAAVKADYHPQYFASDLSEGTTDYLAQSAPDGQLDGALGTTWRRTGSATLGQSADPFDAKCVSTYAKQTGTPAPKWGSDVYGSIASTCALFDTFEKAATTAGKDLTVASFVKGMQSLTNFQLGSGGKGSFGPNKFDAPDEIRSVKYKPSCKCWVPTTDYFPVKF